MTGFRCIPIPAAVADRFRRTRTDDRGQKVLVREPGPDSRCPCRHCLRFAEPGQPVLLASYDLPKPQGVYWTPSPIFVHANSCPRYEMTDHIPEIVRGALVSLRAYDSKDLCLYDLGHVSEGTAIDDALAHALDDARTSYVNIHTAKPGCFFCRVERLL